MNILTLTTSPFYGGPERQMIGLAETLTEVAPEIHHYLSSFPEKGAARPFLEKAAEKGLETIKLTWDFPHLVRATMEVRKVLRERKIDLVLANGHKARCISWLATRFSPVKVIGVSRGWTDENLKMRCYNQFDKWLHKRMTHIIAVSEGQAEKIRRLGIPENRVTVIRNAIRADRFEKPLDFRFREKLEAMFPEKPTCILGAAGRLSPEKGFDLLLDAVHLLKTRGFSVGLVLFGDGFLRNALETKIDALQIHDFAKLPGFTADLDDFLPCFDIFVQSSHSEGLPNVLLEAMAAQTIVVATNVGGTSEVVVHDVTGIIVPPNDSEQLAQGIQTLLNDSDKMQKMKQLGKERIQNLFTFSQQTEQYLRVFQKIVPQSKDKATSFS